MNWPDPNLSHGGEAPVRPPLGLSEEVWSQVVRLRDDIRRLGGVYRFPWARLEEDLAGRDDCLLLFGYGSLLNRASAEVTIASSWDNLRPALAFGLVRVFNYNMPERIVRRYGSLDDPAARAVLNAYPTERAEDVINGVLMRVPRENLRALREREAGYDLIPVPCLGWFDRSAPPFPAFALACPDEAADGVKHTDHTLTPHGAYLDLCLKGARAISPEFEEMFLQSTYLGGFGKRLADLTGGARSDRVNPVEG